MNSVSNYEVLLVPGCEVFVSDFHREKLWRDWFAQQEPDMDSTLRDKTLELMRKMARAPTRDQYEMALKALQGCEGWISSVKLQSWFATVWDAEVTKSHCSMSVPL